MAQLQAERVVRAASLDGTDRSKKFYYYLAMAPEQQAIRDASSSLVEDEDDCFAALEASLEG